jgi:hypothetical protein
MFETIFAVFLGAYISIAGLFGYEEQSPIVGATPVQTVPQGGTGWGNIAPGTLLYGTGSALRLATTSTSSLTASSPLSFTGAVTIIGSANRTLTIDTSGTWSGNAVTASALAADPANCSAGNAPLGIVASGAVEGCFDVWTEAENTSAGYVVGTRALTVAGTANQITSSAGSQNLTADRTWTLSLPNHVIFPSSFVTTFSSSTNGTTTFAGLSNIYAIGSNGLDFHSNNGTPVADFGGGGGSNATFFGGVNIDGTTRLATSLNGILLATAGTVSVATPGTDYANFAYPFVGTSIGFSTSTIGINTAGLISTASSTFHTLNNTYASSTYASFGTATTSALIVSGLNTASCDLKANSFGVISCGTDATGAGSTDIVLWANASTSPWTPLSIRTLSSSTIAFLDSTRATSTDFTATNATSSFKRVNTHLWVAGTLRTTRTSTVLSASSGGIVQATTVSLPLSFSGSTFSCSTCATFGYPFTLIAGNAYQSTSTVQRNTLGFIGNASSSIAFLDSVIGTTTNSTSTVKYVSGHLRAASIRNDAVVSSLISSTGTGVQQTTTVSSPLSFSVNTLSCASCATFAFPYTPATGNLWNATSTLMVFNNGLISNATSSITRLATNFSTSTDTLALPTGANPFTLSDGQCAIDTTSGQFRCDIGTQGERVLTHPEGLFPMVVTFASTSLNTSTTTRYLGPAPQAMTFQKAQCDSSRFLSFSLNDGTNRSTFIIASSTIGTTTFATNNSFFQGESIRMDIGTTTSANINVTAACTLWFTYDKQ